MKKTFVFCLFFLSACSSLVKVVTGPLDPTRLFPDGKYRHHVTLTQKDGIEREFEGVLKLSNTEIILIGLSHFGSTVFQVTDKNGVPPEVVIYFEPMQKYQDQFKDLYLSMKKILIRRNNLNEKKKKSDLSVLIGEKDKNGIPESFEIEHPKFKVKVEVTGYEL